MADSVFGGQDGERALLTGFLDWYRAVVERKVEDLSWEQASRPCTRSGLSPLGVVKHLAYVERHWFRRRFLGDDVELFSGPDNAPTFELTDADTVERVVAAYRAAAAEARTITAAAALDDLAVGAHPVFGAVSLRWILVHLLEETARHAGHLDLMREDLDGRTGD